MTAGSDPMARHRPFAAVIADMDGVLTQTARLHERAWKQVFDAVLKEHPEQPPFSSADYRAHVDGKGRYRGVADFLHARGIDLPEGDPTAAPTLRTRCGIGNRKNDVVLELLEREGVDVFEDAVTAFVRWRRGDLRLGIISASRNCRRVLQAADLERYADVIVDGQCADALALAGKGDILREAARRLGVDPTDAVVLEDAAAGVRAARDSHFGFVVGIARDGTASTLIQAGAHHVASRVDGVRFPRRLPDVWDHLADLAAWRGRRSLAVLLDFDGTLAPIVEDPRTAALSREMRSTVAALAEECPVAILSGRDREDVTSRVGLDGVAYAGSHGFDIALGGRTKMLPAAEAAVPDVARAQRELEGRIGRIPGLMLERKAFSVAVHVRQVQDADARARIHAAVDAVTRETGLRSRPGKEVVEIEPAIEWDKGYALQWLLDALPPTPDSTSPFAVYLGDDETDEDAFLALGGHGAGIHVGGPVATSLADYRVNDPQEVQAFLRALATSYAEATRRH